MNHGEIETLVRQTGGALSEAAAKGVRHGWISLDSVMIDEGANLSITSFVVCPTGPDTDVADFADVIRACLNRSDLDTTGSTLARVVSVIDAAQNDPIDQFVERVGGALVRMPKSTRCSNGPIRSRVCVPSTSRMPPTSSGAASWSNGSSIGSGPSG